MNNILDSLHQEILRDEAKLRAKKRKLIQLATKYSKRSLSQLFPSESATQPFNIDNRQDII